MRNRWRRNPEPYRWADLARYNGEVARGIVHTPEWVEKMQAEQARFNQQSLVDSLIGSAP